MDTIDSGVAALIAALISAISVIIVLLISHRLSFVTGIEQEKRNLIRAQLSEFYDPIFSLLSANNRIFERIGPKSKARWDKTFSEQEIAEVWNKLVERVIIINNLKICEIIQTKLHLLSFNDTIDPYMEFITHAYAYQVFREKPYESYVLFQYPHTFFNHVESERNVLHQHIEKIINFKDSK